MATTKREFPAILFVMRQLDDTFAYFESEEAIPAPVGEFIEVATYRFADFAEYRRVVRLEKRSVTPPTPEVEPPVELPPLEPRNR